MGCETIEECRRHGVAVPYTVLILDLPDHRTLARVGALVLPVSRASGIFTLVTMWDELETTSDSYGRGPTGIAGVDRPLYRRCRADATARAGPAAHGALAGTESGEAVHLASSFPRGRGSRVAGSTSEVAMVSRLEKGTGPGTWSTTSSSDSSGWGLGDQCRWGGLGADPVTAGWLSRIRRQVRGGGCRRMWVVSGRQSSGEWRCCAGGFGRRRRGTNHRPARLARHDEGEPARV